MQIATATGLSQRDISFNLERLLGCGCVKVEDTGHLVLYGLSAPRLLQLEGIVDEMPGRIELYHGKPEIRVLSKSQITEE